MRRTEAAVAARTGALIDVGSGPGDVLANISALAAGGAAMIYDVRFATFSPTEAASIARAAGIAADAVRRDVLRDRRFGLRPYCRITIAKETPIHAG